jgi:osomolarity two-component system sensor histidine kinase SLN1
MRIGIREQLAAIVLLAVLVSLAIVSIPTWIYVNGFVGDVKSQALALTASLKAAQIASVLDQLQVISNAITARGLVQDTLRRYYTNNVTASDWVSAVSLSRLSFFFFLVHN